MYKSIILSISLSLSGITNSATAGGEIRPTGSRSASLGNASVAIIDLWSAYNNQAGLAYVTDPCFGFSYESRFTMKETGYSAMAAAYPLRTGCIGLSAAYFGYSAYHETRFGLAYAKPFGKKLAIAVQLDYITAKLANDYGKRGIVTFEAAMMARISKGLLIGVHIYNPIHAGFSNFSDERVPASLSLGFSFTLTEGITLVAETEKNISDKATLNAGIEYSLQGKLHIRAGISTGQSAFSFGTGYDTGKFQISISTSRHQLLGYSPQITIACKL